MISKRTFLFILIPALILLFGLNQPAQASLGAGQLDTGFDPGTGGNGSVWTSIQDKDGKIFLAGDFTTMNGSSRNRLAKLYADGTLHSFSPGTGANYDIRALAIQSDGKLIIGGDFTTYNGTSIKRIARVNTNGTLDSSFDPGTGANSDVNAIVIQADGKIVIGGEFTTINGTTANYIARLNTDGSLDTSFSPTSGPDDAVETLGLYGTRIYLGGQFTSVNGVSRNRIARMYSTGKLDTAFNPGTGANDTIIDLTLLSLGRIAVVGSFSTIDGNARNRVAWLDSDGSIWTKFNPSSGANSTVRSVVAQEDGKLIIGGLFSTINGTSAIRVARMDIYGDLDESFDPGTGPDNFVYDVALQADGKVLMGGDFANVDGVSRNRIARLHPDGSLDIGLDSGTGAGNPIYTIETVEDQKLIIAGNFSAYDGFSSLSNFARINADGSFDPTFHTGSGPNDIVHDSVLQDDGRKVILVGDFTQVGVVSRGRIARFDTDGYNDSAFNPGSGASADIYAVAIQDDDKILVGGSFVTFNSVSRGRIDRLNDNGSQDAGFNSGGSGANGYIREIVIQDDGKILVGGDFDSFNGSGAGKIVRLNTNGSVDTSFNTGTGFNNDGVEAMGIQSDGKIVVGGWFTTYNGNTGINRIARLNTDGSLDTSFNPGTGLNNVPWQILIQPDDKILLVGGFQLVNGTARNRIARLNADGTLDTSFNYFSGADNPVQDIKIQTGGKLVIVGTFNSYDGQNADYVARVNGGTMPQITTPTAPPDGTVNESYTGMHTFTASGFPAPQFYIHSGDFPPGLRLNPSTGAITGTPHEPGTFTFILGAYNHIDSQATQFVTIKIWGKVFLPLILK